MQEVRRLRREAATELAQRPPERQITSAAKTRLAGILLVSQERQKDGSEPRDAQRRRSVCLVARTEHVDGVASIIHVPHKSI